MYNDTIKVANKIISDKDLEEIFQRMDEEIKENIQLCKQEEIQNERYERAYQNWTVKSFDGSFRCTFNFYDDTNITVDNYPSFVTIYNGRLDEVKSMWVRCSFSYWIQNSTREDYVSQRIDLNIYEDKMDIEVNLSSEDKKMDDIYQLIKDKILRAPERYDRTIKKKGLITNKVGFALGVIPSLILCTLLVFVPAIRDIYSSTYVVYPIAVIFLGFFIGLTFCSGRINRLYAPLKPNQKYIGYDSANNKSMYKDDIDDYVSKSEIIIGKNIHNINNRNEIAELEKKYSKYLPIELIVILVLSVVMILIGLI